MKALQKIIAVLVVCLLLFACSANSSPNVSNQRTNNAYQPYTYYDYSLPTLPSIPEFTFSDFVLPTVATDVDTSNKSEPQSNASTAIQFISTPGTVRRNQTARLRIKGSPNTAYSITVYYNSGPSTASGLYTKTSDSSGYVSWSWRVGGRTSAGTYKIVVSGGGNRQITTFHVEVD